MTKPQKDLKIIDNPFKVIKNGLKVDPEFKKLKQEFDSLLKKFQSKDISFEEKLDLFIKLNSKIIPVTFEELISPVPNADRSIIAYRASSILKDMSSIIIKKKEIEVTDDINPESPRFQMIFGWFLQLFHKVLLDNKIDQVIVNNVFDSLSSELMDWESTIKKRLKGLSSKAVQRMENPFLDKFKNKKKET